jgi:Fe2+ transport system protein FeoA
MRKTLVDLKPGQSAAIAKIIATDSLRQRLYDLGLTPGTQVELIKFAPFGDPLEIRLRNYQLTLRVSEANFVIIEEPIHA